MEPPNGFVVMPYGSKNPTQENYWNTIYEQIFFPALQRGLRKGYGLPNNHSPNVIKVARAKDYADEGDITGKIVSQLCESSFLLADVTGQNPNVMWELGVRHALASNTLLVQVDREYKKYQFVKWSKLPFDLSNFECQSYNPANPQESVTKLARCIAQIIQSRKDRNKKNPVQRFLHLEGHRRLEPNDVNYKKQVEFSSLLIDIENLKSPICNLMLEYFLSKDQDPKLEQLRHGVFAASSTTGCTFPEIVKKAYDAATHIRCTSVQSFNWFWSQGDNYGKELLGRSSALKNHHRKNRTTRIFTGMEMKDIRNYISIFEEQVRNGVDVLILPGVKKEMKFRRALELRLKEVLPGVELPKYPWELKEVELDMMLVDDLCGVLFGLRKQVGNMKGKDDIDEDDILGGLFFHRTATLET